MVVEVNFLRNVDVAFVSLGYVDAGVKLLEY